MEPFVCEIYLNEMYLQCDYALRAVKEFNAALKRKDTEELFRAVHSFLTHVSNVSRLLWPPHEREKLAGKKLSVAAKNCEIFSGYLMSIS